MLEGLLVEQRLGVARDAAGTGRARRSPPPLRRDRPPAPRMAESAHRLASPASTSRAGPASRSPRSRSCSPARRRGRISARTEEAVTAAAQELGYRPNVAARALRTGVARSVALVVPDITNPFFGRVLRGAQRAAQRAGYTVVLVDIGNDRAWEAASLQALLAGPADGLLLFEAELPPGATEHAIQIEMRPGKLPGRAARRRGGRRLRARPPARARPHADRPRRLELRRADLRPAPRADASRGSARRRRRSRAPFTFEGAAAAAGPLLDAGRLHRGLLRRRHPRRRRLPRGARARASRSPSDLSRRRLRRPRLRARARAAADDGRRRRRGISARRRSRRSRATSRGETVAAEQVMPVTLTRARVDRAARLAKRA